MRQAIGKQKTGTPRVLFFKFERNKKSMLTRNITTKSEPGESNIPKYRKTILKFYLEFTIFVQLPIFLTITYLTKIEDNFIIKKYNKCFTINKYKNLRISTIACTNIVSNNLSFIVKITTINNLPVEKPIGSQNILNFCQNCLTMYVSIVFCITSPENEKVLVVENENVQESILDFKKYFFRLHTVCFTL